MTPSATRLSRRYGASRKAERQLSAAESGCSPPVDSGSALRRRPPRSAAHSTARRELLVDRRERRLETEDQDGVGAVSGAGRGRLERVEQPAVRGMQARLRDDARRLRLRRRSSGRDTGARRLEGRPRPDLDPRLGDHAEDPLGAEHHPVGARPGAGPRQPPALPRAGRRQRPDRLDEVVDVGLERREVAARAGRDPAAERRELERLREVAQGQAVRPQAVLELRAEGAGPDQRRAGDLVDRGDPARARGDRARPCRGSRARPGARPRRRRWSRRRSGIAASRRSAHSSRTRRTSSSSRGKATRSGVRSKRPRKPRTTSR